MVLTALTRRLLDVHDFVLLLAWSHLGGSRCDRIDWWLNGKKVWRKIRAVNSLALHPSMWEHTILFSLEWECGYALQGNG